MIKIEVTGGSIPEVADKLMAIGRSLYNTAVNDADNAAREALQAQRRAEFGEAERMIDRDLPFLGRVNPVMPEVAEMAAAPEHANEATEAPSAPDTLPESGTPTSGTGPTAETASPTELDFDTDVAPYVLQVVKEKGKPVAQEILSQFGVEKASSLDPAQWPELVATLKAAL